MTPLQFYDAPPALEGLDRLEVREEGTIQDWTRVHELVQSDLTPLDAAVLARVPSARVRSGSNCGGTTRLFTYRVYEARASDVDPVVAGVTIEIAPDASDDHFMVSADVAGESLGDVLFEEAPRDVIGWEAMTAAARDLGDRLGREGGRVARALGDRSRRG